MVMSLSSPFALPRAAAAAAARAPAGRARREAGGLNERYFPSVSLAGTTPPAAGENERGSAIFPSGIGLPYLPPRQPSLRTAVHDKKVEDAAFSTGSASAPRSAARRERCRLCTRRASHSWLTGA